MLFAKHQCILKQLPSKDERNIPFLLPAYAQVHVHLTLVLLLDKLEQCRCVYMHTYRYRYKYFDSIWLSSSEKTNIQLYFYRTQLLLILGPYNTEICSSQQISNYNSGEQAELPLPRISTLHVDVFSISKCLGCIGNYLYSPREFGCPRHSWM